VAPLFSIVTVCLNAGNDLRTTAESVINQKLLDYEYIIKDGGSKDGSLEFLNNDARYSCVKIVCSHDDGIYSAMNQGLESCIGKYVLFLNAGDVFRNCEVLTRVAEECISENSPGLVYTDYMTTGLMKTIKSPAKLSRSYLFRTMLCHQVCYVKRECYEKYGRFSSDLKIEADYEFLLRLIIKAQVSYKYIPLVSIISLSFGFASKNIDDGLKEVKILRKKYLSGITGFIYGVIYSMTSPRVRMYLMRNRKMRHLQKLYLSFVNVCQEIANKRQ